MKIQQFQKVRPTMTPEQHEQKLREVSELYEKQFLREMVKAMRGTISESELTKPSHAEKIFREQLDQEYVEKWGDKGGIGLSDLIYQQLVDRMGPALGLKSAPVKPVGPISIGQKDQIPEMKRDPIHSGQNQVQLKYNLDQDSDRQLKSPWAGSLLEAKQINPDEYVVKLKHDNGIQSQLVFKGTLDQELQPEIHAGQRIGLLSGDAKNLFWTLETKE